jgi:hypothetical protein
MITSTSGVYQIVGKGKMLNLFKLYIIKVICLYLITDFLRQLNFKILAILQI